ncbi:hypothetical protein M5K25_019319 [Dendrobium thyrsiflorum]|uniref:Uncharacterized protein n=1 Tax=Dendrobium thyrsiflorum TaxID=117978 RepID=A0ABD0ULJ2_DENTH
MPSSQTIMHIPYVEDDKDRHSAPPMHDVDHRRRPEIDTRRSSVKCVDRTDYRKPTATTQREDTGTENKSREGQQAAEQPREGHQAASQQTPKSTMGRPTAATQRTPKSATGRPTAATQRTPKSATGRPTAAGQRSPGSRPSHGKAKAAPWEDQGSSHGKANNSKPQEGQPAREQRPSSQHKERWEEFHNIESPH